MKQLSYTYKRLSLPPLSLAECPLWHQETKEYVFADIESGRLFACTPSGTVRLLLSCWKRLGAFLFDEAGDIVLFTEKGVFLLPYERAGEGEEAFQLLWNVPMQADERFNDAIADPKGRMIAGTKTDRCVDGSLWVFEAGLEPRRVLSGLKISNGMGFADNARVFYHTDSGDQTIYQYVYDPESGNFTGRQPFTLIREPKAAVPDGMTVDENGTVWSACWGGGCVHGFTRSGQPYADLYLPSGQVSSLIFGGEDLAQVLVTTAAVGTVNDPDVPSAAEASLQEKRTREDGSVYLVSFEEASDAETAVPRGVEEFRARLRK